MWLFKLQEICGVILKDVVTCACANSWDELHVERRFRREICMKHPRPVKESDRSRVL